jgi:hypothetical protein
MGESLSVVKSAKNDPAEMGRRAKLPATGRFKTDKSKTSHSLFGGKVLTDEKSVQKILRSIFNPTHHFVLFVLTFLLL